MSDKPNTAVSCDAISHALNQLHDFYAQLDAIELRYQQELNGLLTPDQRTWIQLADAQKRQSLQDTNHKIKLLEESIRAAVTTHKANVSGEHMQAIYNRGRISWNTTGLLLLAVKNTAVADCMKQGQPYVTIKKKAS